MRRGFKSFLIIFLLIFASVVVAVAGDLSDDLSGNPHVKGAEKYCSLCHTLNPPQLIDDHVETCTNCHIGNIANHPVTRHPIDVEVKIKIPGPLPLTSEGRLVCSTCHDPHNDYGFSNLLRVQYHMLCIQCHRGY